MSLIEILPQVCVMSSLVGFIILHLSALAYSARRVHRVVKIDLGVPGMELKEIMVVYEEYLSLEVEASMMFCFSRKT